MKYRYLIFIFVALAAVIAAAALFFLPAQEVPPLVISDTQVNITPGATVVSAENSRIRYCVGNDTLCGVLSALAEEKGLEFVIEDHAWNPRLHSQAIGSLAGYTASDNATWNCTVNGVPVLLESAEDGLCSYKVNDSDEVCFFFGTPGQDASEVAAIVRTRVHFLSGQEVPAENWSLSLRGVSAATIGPEIYAEAMRCHGVAVTTPSGTVWSGVPVFFFVGVVDGEESPDHPMLSSRLASTGYTVTFTGQNNSTLALPSDAVIRNNSYILAYMKDDALLSADPGCGPLALVGPGMEEVPFGGVTGITLSDFEQPPAPPEIRIVRYMADGTTPLNETTVNTTWMRENLPVLGNESAPYRFQGPTFDPSDLWDPAEKTNLAKVEDAVLGTSIRDLCDRIGGMRPGERLRLTASDGYVTELAYENIYDPSERQGEAILSWWSLRQGYAPDYQDGPRLFFLAPDHTFGNEDMRLCIPEDAWTHYWTEGVQFPAASGLSIRGVVEVAILPA